jgi:sarcosine oxidase
MRGFVGQPIVATRICQTEYSSNGDFIIDRHPDFDTVWIAGGGSGHACETGPRLGAHLAGRILGRADDTGMARRFAWASHGSAPTERASI